MSRYVDDQNISFSTFLELNAIDEQNENTFI